MKVLAVWLAGIFGLGLTYVIWVNVATVVERRRERATALSMREITELLEGHLRHGGTLPELDEVPISEARGKVVGSILATAPDRDGWGEPFRIRTRARSFVVLSYGSDRRPSPVRTSGGHDDPAEDRILVNGWWWSQTTHFAIPPMPEIEGWSFEELLDHDHDEVRALVSTRAR